jgi:conjugative relaxase-like TrwC/TraI family protein
VIKSSRKKASASRKSARASARRQCRYINDGVPLDDPNGPAEYYIGGSKRGRLNGQAWARLRGQGRLDTVAHGLGDAEFENLYLGLAPDGRSTLVAPMRGVHAPGWDMQASPPKSVSVAFIDATAAERDLLEAIHHDANDAMVAYVEETARVARIKRDGVQHNETAEMLVYSVTHHTARANAETEARGQCCGDPQIHDHNYCFNIVWSDGRWRAPDHRRVVHVQPAAEAIYKLRSLDRYREADIAFEVFRDDKGRWTYELAGSDRRQRHFWSTRSRAVGKETRKFEREHGRPPTSVENIELARKGRGKHDHNVPRWEHFREVREGVIRAVIAAGGTGGGYEPQPIVYGAPQLDGTLEERRAAVRERLLGPEGLVAHPRGRFERWRITPAVLNACIGLLTAEEALDFAHEFALDPELVTVRAADNGDSDYDICSTERLRRAERRVSDLAHRKHREQHASPSEIAVEMQLRRAGFAPTEEQRAAHRAFCSPSGFEVLQGEAGTGKSSVLKWMASAYRAEQVADKVIVVSKARAAAKRSSAAIEADIGTSVDALLLSIANGLKITSRTVLIIEESAMVDTPAFARLMEQCDSAIVRIVGDPHQLQAIGAGGLHIDIAERIGVNPLTEVMRQNHEWYIEVCRAIRANAGERALHVLDEHDGWHVTETHAEAIGELVATWEHYRETGVEVDGRQKRLGVEDICVVTDQPNVVVDTLNRLIQDRRRERGELSGPGLMVHDDVDNRTETYYRGDLYVFRSTYGRGRAAVSNGDRGVIEHVDAERAEIIVRVRNRSIHVRLSDVAEQPGHLGYAGSAHTTQGAEAEVALVLPGYSTTDAVSGYSMTSRGKETVHVFASKEMHGDHALADLGRRWSEYDPNRLVSREIDVRDAMAAEIIDPQAEHDFVDEMSVSVTTLGWHMSQRVREQMRRRRASDPDFERAM